MTTKHRTSLGFDDDAAPGFDDAFKNFDAKAFVPEKPKPSNDRPDPIAARKAAEAAGFESRGPAKPAAPRPAPVQQRRRRTGRNVQFNVKLKQETIDGLTAIADANEWGLGETVEKALVMLERENADKNRS